MTNKQIYGETKQFLEILSQGNSDEVFHFQTFDDNEKTKRPHLIRTFTGKLDEHYNELVKLNNLGAGVFVCVNQNKPNEKRDTKNILKVRSLFADNDNGNFESFPLLPSMVIQSKNGQHAYWLTNEISCNDFTDMQMAVINNLQSDPKIKDLPRVMRLPGFFHRKDPNNIFLVRVHEYSGAVYSSVDLHRAFPKVDRKNLEISKIKGNHLEISKYINSREGAIQGESGDLKTFQMACDLVRGFNLSDEDALNYLKKYNEKCVPMWSESELIIKIKSARKSGSGETGYLLKNVTTEQWVHRFLQKNSVKTKYNQAIYFNEECISAASLIRKAEIAWDNEGRKSKLGVIKSILEEWEIASRKEIVQRLRTVFTFNANLVYQHKSDPLTEFTTAIVGKNCPDLLQHRAVLGHFIWQVKRKLFQLPSAHVICPVLVGKQGCGKSRALDMLIRPLKPFSIDGNLSLFSRENEKFAFGTYYIFKLDEFAGVDKAELESVKQLMDSESVNFRAYYTQKMTHMPNISCFIAASNTSITDVIRDQTGTRRFYEIPCIDKLDWNTIGGHSEDHGIDYHALWRMIDENANSPLIPFKDAVETYQKKFRSKSYVEQWLEDKNLIPMENTTTELKSAAQLHKEFMLWLKDQGNSSSYTTQSLGKELRKYLTSKHRNDGTYYFVKGTNTFPVSMNLTAEDSKIIKNEPQSDYADLSVDEFVSQSLSEPITWTKSKK